jgi:ABC-type transport system involved in multi-copper enzyme maturation permease subunit
MKSSVTHPLRAIIQTEMLYNTRRIAPYALFILFSGNAILWWAGGPAISRGWATNSDFYIVRLFGGFSFMTLPLFTAMMMGDPVIRDFRVRIDPLIFSKPINRMQYLLGKFLGNFLVLIICQSGFALTLFLLQAFRTTDMIVLPARAFPYLKHFVIFVIISNLALAALCFAIGTLTRNVKIVYGLMTAFYLLYIGWQLTLKGLPPRWRIALDPLLFNVITEVSTGKSSEWLNQLVIHYSADMLINRVLMLGLAISILVVVYLRFSLSERASRPRRSPSPTLLNLSTQPDRLYDESQDFHTTANLPNLPRGKPLAMPAINLTNVGLVAEVKKFLAAVTIEFRLLSAERSSVVLIPLVVFLCTVQLSYFGAPPDVSVSAAYATSMADSLMFLFFAITIFYTGEALHRDRELRIEPVLWSAPTANWSLLLAKFIAIFLLTFMLWVAVTFLAILVQLFRGQTPVEPGVYVLIYLVVLLPGVVFMIGASVALNVFLRDKYLVYAVSLGLGGGLFYLFNQGHNHWLYNPVLYNLWRYSSLIEPGKPRTLILTQRLYWLAFTTLGWALAHLFYARKTHTGWVENRRLTGKSWTILLAVLAAIIACITGAILAWG